MAKLGKKAAINRRLAKGAAEIRSAQKKKKKESKKDATLTVVPPAPVVIPDLTRGIDEILRDRVTILPGSIGVALHEETPLEEALGVLDYVRTMQDHVGFMVGDVINFSEAKYGEKFSAAMHQTGRALSTLKGYAEVSRKIAPEDRVAALSFSHHREIVRLNDAGKRKEVLKDAAKAANSGKLPTTKELRYKVQRMQPVKVKTTKTTSGKGKKGKGKRKVIEAYKPTDEEQSQIDVAEEKISEARELLIDKGLQKVLLKVDNATKKQWNKMLEPFYKFANELEKATGY